MNQSNGALGGYGITPETEGWGLPVHSSLYFSRVGQEVLWHKAIQVVFRADPEVLRELVPEPIELAGDEVTVGMTEHFQPVHGLPIVGCSVSLRARYGELKGRHTVMTVSTSDESVCAGREELGRSSILGDVRMWAKGNTWWGVASRDGSDIFRISVFPERVVPDDEVKFWGGAGPLLEYKKIPSADPSRRPWRQILAIESERRGRLVELSVGRGAIEWIPSVWGLHHIKPLGPVGGTVWHFEGGLLKSIDCLWEDRPEPVR
jgi:hypothetical protein